LAPEIVAGIESKNAGLVGAVTERLFCGVLTSAERISLLLRDREFLRFVLRALVGAIAQRLVLGATAATPPIGARLQLHDDGIIGGSYHGGAFERAICHGKL
jgi:hypothetical protein